MFHREEVAAGVEDTARVAPLPLTGVVVGLIRQARATPPARETGSGSGRGGAAARPSAAAGCRSRAGAEVARQPVAVARGEVRELVERGRLLADAAHRHHPPEEDEGDGRAPAGREPRGRGSTVDPHAAGIVADRAGPQSTRPRGPCGAGASRARAGACTAAGSRGLVWHTAIACVAIGVFAFWQEQFSYLSAFGRGDFRRASAVLDQLGWVGKDSATARLAVGSQLLQRGDVDGARREFERSVALRETPDGYTMLGRIEESKQDARGALAAYQRALAVDPNRRDVLVRAGQLLLALGGDAEGRALLDRAAALESAEQAARREPASARTKQRVLY